MTKAWSLIVLGEDRQYGGNTGYADDLRRVYRYDSNVANHKRILPGDLVLLRNRHGALGTALIADVIQSEGFKTVRRCPECDTTGIKERKTKAPPWRCNNKHEFFEPTESEEPVTKYEASFGDTYSGIEREIETQTIKSIALRPSDQLSMEELDLAEFEELLSQEPEVLTKIRKALIARNLSPEDLDALETNEFVPSMTDQRNTVIRSIKERRGQTKFRNALIKRYGSRCVVTGCGVLEILEAAHITPYRGEAYNDPSNGLLLRADIHTLFDLNLMWIEPDTYKVVFDDKVLEDGYGAFNGKAIAFNKQKPSDACLLMRWQSRNSQD